MAGQYTEGQRLQGSDGKIYRVRGGVPVLDAPAQPQGIPIKPANPRQPYEGPLSAADLAAKGQEAQIRALQIKKMQDEASGSNGGLEPATIDMIAHQYILSGQLPPLGMGASAAADRRAILNRVSQVVGVRSGENLQVGISRYKNGVKAIGNLENQLGTISTNEGTASANAEQYLSAIRKVFPQDSWALSNAARSIERKFVNDPDYTAYDTARNTFLTEYAKVVAGTPTGAGTLSDSARREQMDVLRSTTSPAAAEAAITQMRADMRNRVGSYQTNIQRGYSNLEAGRSVGATSNGDLVDERGAIIPPSRDPTPGALGAMTGNTAPPGSPPPGNTPPPTATLGPRGGPVGSPNLSTDVSQLRPDAGPGAGPGSTSIEKGSVEHFSTVQDRAYQAALQSAFNKGAPRAQLQALASKFGYPPLGADLDAAIAYRDKGGHGAAINLPQSGVRPLSLGEQANNAFADSDVGTGAIHAGLAAGALPNGVSRLAGRALGFNGDMRQAFGNPEQNDAVMSYLDTQHHKSAIAGDIIGGVAGAGGLEALAAKGLLKAGVGEGTRAVAAPLIGDATFGALQGAGTAQQGSELQGGLIGSLAGLGGGAAGRHVIGPKIVAPLIAPVINSRAGVATNNAVRGMFGRAPAPIAPIAPAASDLMVANTAQKAGIPDIQARLAEAQALRVPMSLADTNPQLTTLAGAAVRRSPAADQIAQDAFLPRSRGQIDRLGQAVDTHLGPVGNIPQISADLQAQARTAAAPLYDRAYAAPVMSTPQIDGALNTPFGRGALSRAQTIAANEGRAPQELGISFDASGQPVLNPRPNQAIADHLAARSELDAAQQAFREARSSPASLDAARTRVERAREGLRASDAALAAAPDPTMPASALGYTAQSLDYVKRGMDDTLEQYRNPMTNRLQLDEAGRAQLGVKNNLLNAMDAANPDYAAARRAYAGPMQSRDALARGQDAFTANPNQLGVDIAGQSPEQMAQMQLGYRGALMDQANRVRFSGNPFDATLGNPAAEQRLSTMYPGNPGNADLLRTRDLESGLARSTTDILGNSKTAQRGIADQSFAGGDGGQMLLDAGLNLATGQVPIGLIARKGALQGVKDAYQMGVGKRATAKADAMAPLLFNTNPAQASASLADLLNSSQAYRDFMSAQRGKYGRVGGMLGASVAPMATGF